MVDPEILLARKNWPFSARLLCQWRTHINRGCLRAGRRTTVTALLDATVVMNFAQHLLDLYGMCSFIVRVVAMLQL